jgi:hypothetical protein
VAYDVNAHAVVRQQGVPNAQYENIPGKPHFVTSASVALR